LAFGPVAVGWPKRQTKWANGGMSIGKNGFLLHIFDSKCPQKWVCIILPKDLNGFAEKMHYFAERSVF
jgi:hypothetical protein